MGEVAARQDQGRLEGLGFNRSIRVEPRSERLSDGAGALLIRQALERTGTVRALREDLIDPREQKAITHPMEELALTRIAMLALGWRDQNDATGLRNDPVMRLAVSNRRGAKSLRPVAEDDLTPDGLASQATLSRMTANLATEKNRRVLEETVIEQACQRLLISNKGRKLKRLVVDFDGFPIGVSGHQSGSEYNGHYHQQMFSPLVAMCGDTGDILGVRLRVGTAGAAAGFDDFVVWMAASLLGHVAESILVRVDAGFVSEAAMSRLEELGIDYVGRVKNNSRLDAVARPFLRRPPGRPTLEPREWLHEMKLPLKKGGKDRRVVLVVQERADDLYLHHFWLVTSLREQQRDASSLLAIYRLRGKAEGHIGEFSGVVAPALSSALRGDYSHTTEDAPAEKQQDYIANEVTLLLAAIAYNAMHLLRCLAPAPSDSDGWSLRRLRERALRVAARITLGARRVFVSITDLAAAVWGRISARLKRFQLRTA